MNRGSTLPVGLYLSVLGAIVLMLTAVASYGAPREAGDGAAETKAEAQDAKACEQLLNVDESHRWMALEAAHIQARSHWAEGRVVADRRRRNSGADSKITPRVQPLVVGQTGPTAGHVPMHTRLAALDDALRRACQ